ncbi:EmrB/QacA subfamily drug resistance transporter [Virgibacillus halotolerans]|uniref:DHA2 family efflux MFS transporter permease subunit n=1 Tax=Virgibacillus halotolerans TaxID=1071053 RepID=UPI001961DD49|nr:DHA2 family efflux MFS transporter permease subunit [Virgibacillus halotolerans]MBM7598892.1 EmrB/QacA subfamily drug resistance transporter [Virgibacillus halotolerans]
MVNKQTAKIPHKGVIAIVLSSTFLFTFSQFLLITAYPTIMEEFNVNATQIQWLTTAFLLTTVVFIPMTGYLSNTFSSRALVIFSMIMLVIGTMVGFIAPNFITLILSRIIQAVGAGIMLPLVQVILLSIFPYEKRGFAMGLLGAVVNVAPASAPSISGIVIDLLNWRALHLIMLLLVLVVFLFALFYMKNVTEQQISKLDMISIVLSGIGFVSIIFGMSNVSILGFGHWRVIVPIVLGGLALTVFIKRQLRLELPVLNLRLFQKKTFLLSVILIFINMMLLLSTETILPMFSQDVLGTSAFLSGFVLVPGTILLSIMTIISGNLYDNYGGRRIAIIGFTLIMLSTFLLSTVSMHQSPYLIMVYFCLFMLGFGLTLMPLVTVSVNALNNSEIPHGSAIVNTARQFGMAFGVIVLTTVISITTNQMDVPYKVATYWGSTYAFIIMGVLAFIGACLSLLLNEDRDREVIETEDD